MKPRDFAVLAALADLIVDVAAGALTAALVFLALLLGFGPAP